MPTLHSTPLAVLWCAALLACGSNRHGEQAMDGASQASSESGTAASTGTVEGHALAPKYAAFASGTDDQNTIYVVLSSQQSYCQNVARGITNPNHTTVVLGMSTVAADATTPRPSPGTFAIVSAAPEQAGNQAQGGFYVSDGACKSALKASDGLATGGSITLSAVSDLRVAGTFSLDVGSDHVDGTFDAVFCQGLKDEITNNVALSCQAP